MSLIRITYSGVADYMASTPSQQRKILAQYKFPNEDESRAKTLYYKEAKDNILSYHKHKKSRSWLEEQAVQLQQLADFNSENPTRRSRLRNNARSLLDYAKNYTSDSCEILNRFSGKLLISGVQISVVPDLHIIENGKEKLVKLDFAKIPHKDHFNKVSCHLLQMISNEAGLNLAFGSHVVRHIATRSDVKMNRLAVRLANDINATCSNIAAIWESL